MRVVIALLLVIISGQLLIGQANFYAQHKFTELDSLRGSLRPERTCYDVHYYALHLALEPEEKSISGHVDIHFIAVEDFETLQIDLYANMEILKISSNGENLDYERIHNAVFVHFQKGYKTNEYGMITVEYGGAPTEANNPPWDGGIVWSQDKLRRNWFAVACEGDGASLWWPNKDHLSDEPDSLLIQLIVPSELTAVANGNLRGTEEVDEFLTRYDWFVSYPINNYNVTFNVGHYAHFEDKYYAKDGDSLHLDYYVLDYNEERAREHFKQTHGVLEAYEHYMGKYPFWEDGFCLVETPYLGMEHQSAIAYGNQYMRGYMGGMIPRGMNWDYIIVHETGHEYFGNSIGCGDLAEMWIHESFTTYLETLYVEYHSGKDEAIRYINSQRYNIINAEPILGPMGVNWEDWGGSDHYFKGAWMLHTLRHAIGDDALWEELFRGFYEKHAISIITTDDFVQYVNEATGSDWSTFFEQYLSYPDIPVLEYRLEEKGNHLTVHYRWQADVEGFDMPILLGSADNRIRVQPTTNTWQKVVLFDTNVGDFGVADELFLVKEKLVKK